MNIAEELGKMADHPFVHSAFTMHHLGVPLNECMVKLISELIRANDNLQKELLLIASSFPSLPLQHDGKSWLKGNRRIGEYVYTRCTFFCCGCVHRSGAIHIIVLPEERPDYPFDEGDCPVCMNKEFRNG